MKRKIYLASSWRNSEQSEIVTWLRDMGHEVYDFRNPVAGENGFSWADIEDEWKDWTIERYAELLPTNPIAQHGFNRDKAALDWCDTCVLLLPCGRSAHLELGYAAGQAKDTYVLLSQDKFEPELMYLLNTAVACSRDKLATLLN